MCLQCPVQIPWHNYNTTTSACWNIMFRSISTYGSPWRGHQLSLHYLEVSCHLESTPSSKVYEIFDTVYYTMFWRWDRGEKINSTETRSNEEKRTLCLRLACAPLPHNGKSTPTPVWGWLTLIRRGRRCCYCSARSHEAVGWSRDLGCHWWVQGGRHSYRRGKALTRLKQRRRREDFKTSS